MATNMVKIKQLMRKVKEREAQKEVENTPTPVKALWKSEKYKDVPSKLKLDMSVSKMQNVNCVYSYFNTIKFLI